LEASDLDSGSVVEAGVDAFSASLYVCGEPGVPDLACEGSLTWTDVTPGEIVSGEFEVSNIGEEGSFLDWEVSTYPSWGSWSFNPAFGTGLAAGNLITIDVEVVAPDEQNTEFIGEIRIENIDDPGDFCIIPVLLTTRALIPNLICEGELSWTDVNPGNTVYGNFTVENIGEEGSLLDWETESYPSWGSWSFDPMSGTGLPASGSIFVEVEVSAPVEENMEFEGEIRIVNSENSSDFCIIPVYLKTPFESEFVVQQGVQRLFQNQFMGRAFFPF
jgi:hypothetical protein